MFEKENSRSIGSDNHSGVHPKIMQALLQANVGHSPSYGTDTYTNSVLTELKKVFGPSAEMHFVFNGTAANVLCLKSLMKSYEAVLCADTAHLHMDECGAPENLIGCKLLSVSTQDGKLTPESLTPYLIRGGDQHYSQPRVVSITQPTEYGTVYTLEEMRALRDFTRKHNMYLHIDGARLIYAAHFLDCSLKNLTEDIGVDAVSFGGTKNGLLFGEIVILYNESAKKDFKYIRKQAMQLPSKMRFLTAQFEVLLNSHENLWKTITQHGHELALYFANGLKDIKSVQITQKVEANSVFALIPKKWHKELRDTLFYYVWDEKGHTDRDLYEVRWMLSFDSKKEDLDLFLKKLHSLEQGGK